MAIKITDGLRAVARENGVDYNAYETYDELANAIKARNDLRDSTKIVIALITRRRFGR